MKTSVQFYTSDAVMLAGNFYVPDHTSSRVPGLVLGHGFAAVHYPKMIHYLTSLGYGVLDFDFRGYGLSGGDRGHVVPHEQVLDLQAAITYVAQRPEIDPERIGVIGSSLGGTVAIMEAADDQRVKVCVAGCPIANGESTFRLRHNTEEKFAAFLQAVKAKRANKERVARWDIIFIPESLRKNLPAGIPMEFTPETVDGFLAIDALQAVPRIAPRPLLIVHATDDHVVPFEEAQALAARAGKNCELELVGPLDHHIFLAESVIHKIGDWLDRHMPIGPIATPATTNVVKQRPE